LCGRQRVRSGRGKSQERAQERETGRRTHKELGITCCLDSEVVDAFFSGVALGWKGGDAMSVLWLPGFRRAPRDERLTFGGLPTRWRPDPTAPGRSKRFFASFSHTRQKKMTTDGLHSPSLSHSCPIRSITERQREGRESEVEDEGRSENQFNNIHSFDLILRKRKRDDP